MQNDKSFLYTKKSVEVTEQTFKIMKLSKLFSDFCGFSSHFHFPSHILNNATDSRAYACKESFSEQECF